MALTPNEYHLYQKRLGYRQAQRDGHVETLGEAEPKKEDSRETNLTNTLISDFQTPEL